MYVPNIHDGKGVLSREGWGGGGGGHTEGRVEKGDCVFVRLIINSPTVAQLHQPSRNSVSNEDYSLVILYEWVVVLRELLLPNRELLRLPCMYTNLISSWPPLSGCDNPVTFCPS